MTNQHTEALNLASHGWHVVPMFTGTKNPGNILGSGWQHQCSNDPAQINRWYAQTPDANVGVLLGPKSNLIDVEYDSEEGRSILEAICDGIITPTYKSAKSVHRLFSYDERYESERQRSDSAAQNGGSVRTKHSPCFRHRCTKPAFGTSGCRACLRTNAGLSACRMRCGSCF